MARVCFAFGARDVIDAGLVARTLKALAPDCDELRSGAARGADRLAADWARARGWNVREYPADWNTLGRSAGIRRTEQIIRELPADALCIAFAPRGVQRPQGRARDVLSPGTRFTIGALLKAGFRPWLVWADGSMSQVVPDSGPRPPGWYEPNKSQRMDLCENDSVDLGEEGWDATTARSFGDGERRSQNFGETRKGFQARGRQVTCRMCGEPCRPHGEDALCEMCNEQVYA